MIYEDGFEDTSYNMELEKIKNKIMGLYNELVVNTYRQSNPQATPEAIEEFLEENAIEFKGEDGFNEEADRIKNLLDLLTHEDDTDEAAERDYEKHDVAKGSVPKDKTHDRLFKAPTKPFDVAGGGLFNRKESQYRPSTKPLRTPTGSIKRLIDDAPKVSTKSLEDVWNAEREKLLELVRKRNKEHGVKFW